MVYGNSEEKLEEIANLETGKSYLILTAIQVTLKIDKLSIVMNLNVHFF